MIKELGFEFVAGILFELKFEKKPQQAEQKQNEESEKKQETKDQN